MKIVPQVSYIWKAFIFLKDRGIYLLIYIRNNILTRLRRSLYVGAVEIDTRKLIIIRPTSRRGIGALPRITRVYRKIVEVRINKLQS